MARVEGSSYICKRVATVAEQIRQRYDPNSVIPVGRSASTVAGIFSDRGQMLYLPIQCVKNC